MSNGKVLVEKKERITTITINRPESHNAVDRETAELLARAWMDFRDDDEQYVAILTGAGEDAFCAGADLKTLAPGEGISSFSRNAVRRFVYNGPGYMGYTRQTDIFKPILSAVNGYAFAGGLELACLGDMRVVSENAEFGVLCRRWNVGLADGGTQRLRHIVGLGNAMELILTGKRIDAPHAYRIGLANEVVPKGQALSRAWEIAQEISRFPQGAVRTDKQAVMNGLGRPLEEGLRIEAMVFQSLLDQYDFYEGPRAFVEKRPPQFRQDDGAPPRGVIEARKEVFGA